MLFVKTPYSIADVPGLRNICVSEKCCARQANPRSERNSVLF
jgi:hypothetical protein